MQGGHNDRPQHGKVGFSRVAGVMCTATQLDRRRACCRVVKGNLGSRPA
jgi:hypothetical protein